MLLTTTANSAMSANSSAVNNNGNGMSAASEFAANDHAYIAQLYAAQQQAVASLTNPAETKNETHPNGVATSASSSSSPGAANVTVASNGVVESKTNLIINYLPHTMTQDEVRSLFSSMGQLASCRLIRDRNTGQSLGYAFVEFVKPEDAKRAQLRLNGLRLQNKTIKVSLARPSHEAIKGANLYVSGLPRSLTQPELEQLFAPFGNIITSRILSDNVTGLSKGVGFVRFDKKNEAEIAVERLNGTTPAGFTEPLQVKFANNPASNSQKTMIQMAQAASALLPLSVLQQAALSASGAAARPSGVGGAPAVAAAAMSTAAPAPIGGGPIHHQPTLGRFRYSPLGLGVPAAAHGAPPLSTASGTMAPALGAGGLMSGLPTADLLTTNALLQMQMSANVQQQLAALQQACSAGIAAANPAVGASLSTSPPTLTAPAGGFCIYVYNLAPEIEESMLWRLFGPFGAVLSVKIVKDTVTNKCKGYGFVNMTNYDEATSAITNLNGTQLAGRTLQVSFKVQNPTLFR